MWNYAVNSDAIDKRKLIPSYFSYTNQELNIDMTITSSIAVTQG